MSIKWYLLDDSFTPPSSRGRWGAHYFTKKVNKLISLAMTFPSIPVKKRSRNEYFQIAH